LAKVQANKHLTQIFYRLGTKTTKAVTQATVLRLPRGQLKKTSKFVMAVAMGVAIVTDKWMYEASSLGHF
jgi:hypothetical protein